MTVEEEKKVRFTAQIENILEDSPTFKDCREILAEKLWKLKDATYNSNEELERGKNYENRDLCKLLLDIKEKQITRIKGVKKGAQLTINIPNGFEQLLEKEIEQRGLNQGPPMKIKEVIELVLQDKSWLYDVFSNTPTLSPNQITFLRNPELLEDDYFIEGFKKQKEKNINANELISMINEKSHLHFNNLDECVLFLKNVLNEIINKEGKDEWEKSLLEILAKAYLQSKPCMQKKLPITIDFLRETIKDLNRKVNHKSKLSKSLAKLNIALTLFKYKGKIPDGFPLQFMCNDADDNYFPAVFGEEDDIPDSLLEIHNVPNIIAVPLVCENGLLTSMISKDERPTIPTSEYKHVYKVLRKCELISEAEGTEGSEKRPRPDHTLNNARKRAQVYYLKWNEDKNEIYTPIDELDSNNLVIRGNLSSLQDE